MEIERFRHHLTGPVASINTPFLKDGLIDFDGLNRFVDFTIESGGDAYRRRGGGIDILYFFDSQ